MMANIGRIIKYLICGRAHSFIIGHFKSSLKTSEADYIIIFMNSSKCLNVCILMNLYYPF